MPYLKGTGYFFSLGFSFGNPEKPACPLFCLLSPFLPPFLPSFLVSFLVPGSLMPGFIPNAAVGDTVETSFLVGIRNKTLYVRLREYD